MIPQRRAPVFLTGVTAGRHAPRAGWVAVRLPGLGWIVGRVPRCLTSRAGRTTCRALAVLALWGLAPAVSGVAVAAYQSQTPSPNSSLAAGTVRLTDNDGSTAMLSLAQAVPGTTDVSCVRVTFSGGLTSTVRLHATMPATNPLAPYLTLKVTRGGGETGFDNCANFIPDTRDMNGAGAGVLYHGKLSSYPASFASGLADEANTGETAEVWTTGESHSYKFEITLDNNVAAEGLSASAAFAWTAQNT